MASELTVAVADLKEQEVQDLVIQRLQMGDSPLELLEELHQGLDIVGERYSRNEYYLSELILSGEIFKQTAALIEPHIKNDDAKQAIGKIVIGTPRGDIHDIGKDIAVTLLKIAGFEVFDLGVDVPSQNFIDKVQETNASILGMSALITPTFGPMKEIVDLLKQNGLHENVKVIIGGGITTEQVRDYVGADAQTIDAAEGVNICKNFVKESQR